MQCDISDSAWNLGWIGEKNILLDPKETANIGRFLNCQNSPKEMNCRPYIAATHFGIFIYFVANRDINSG